MAAGWSNLIKFPDTKHKLSKGRHVNGSEETVKVHAKCAGDASYFVETGILS